MCLIATYTIVFLSLQSSVFAAGLPIQPEKGNESVVALTSLTKVDLALDFFTDQNPETATLVDTRSRFGIPVRDGNFSIAVELETGTAKRKQLWLQLSASTSGKGLFEVLNMDNFNITPRKSDNLTTRLIISGKITSANGKLSIDSLESNWATIKKSIASTDNITQVSKDIFTTPVTLPKIEPPKDFDSALDKIRQEFKLEPGQFKAFVSVINNDGETSTPIRIYASDQFLQWFDPNSDKKTANLLSRPTSLFQKNDGGILRLRITFSSNKSYSPLGTLALTASVKDYTITTRQSMLQSTLLHILDAKVTLELGQADEVEVSYNWNKADIRTTTKTI